MTLEFHCFVFAVNCTNLPSFRYIHDEVHHYLEIFLVHVFPDNGLRSNKKYCGSSISPS